MTKAVEPIEFTYVTNLEDIVKLHTRLFFRSAESRKSRWLNAAILAFGTWALSWLLARSSAPSAAAPVSAAAGLLMGIWSYVSFPAHARKRIRKLVAREYRDRTSSETTYRLDQAVVSVDSFDTEIRFGLDQLSEISEDDSHVYLDFGPMQACVIPKEAVETETLRNFLCQLREFTESVSTRSDPGKT